MLEKNIERYLVREVERIGGQAPKWASPGNRGVPDRIVILPDGRTIYVEMKAPGKILRPLQRKWRKTLLGMGQEYYLIDSIDAVDRFIRSIHPGGDAQ